MSTTILSGGLVTFEIKVNGSAIPDLVEVHDIEINTKVNEISRAQIAVMDGDPSMTDFPISSSATFVPGSKITIEAGYDMANKMLFQGVITGQMIEMTENQGSLLIIDCYDEAVGMTVGEKNKEFSNQTDSEIITSIIRDYTGLSSDITTTSAKWAEINQSQSTDWDFIRYRAEANGCVVTTKDNKVKTIRPEIGTSSVLSITYGDNLYSFQGTLNAINQLGSYTTQASNGTLGTASNTYPGPGNLSSKKLSEVLRIDASTITSLSLPEDTLEELSKAQLIKSSMSKIQGVLEIQGSSVVSPATYITLQGLGGRFNGDHFVSSVQHIIKGGNWITKISVGMDVVWIRPAPDRIGSSVNKSEKGIKGVI